MHDVGEEHKRPLREVFTTVTPHFADVSDNAVFNLLTLFVGELDGLHWETAPQIELTLCGARERLARIECHIIIDADGRIVLQPLLTNLRKTDLSTFLLVFNGHNGVAMVVVEMFNAERLELTRFTRAQLVNNFHF